MKKTIGRWIRIFITYLKYGKFVKETGVIIKESKITGTGHELYKNVIITKSTMNENVIINKRSIIQGSTLYGFNKVGCNCSMVDSVIGKFSYVADDAQINLTKIGKFCSIGPNFKAGLGSHPANFMSSSPLFYSPTGIANFSLARKAFFEEYKKSEIGNDVWIGSNVVLIDGIKISDGAIIGAGSVVTKDVPPYAIVGGVPAKIIKYRHNPEIIEKLLSLKWWDNDLSWLTKHIKYFQQPIDNISNLKDID
ncbi:CatB-related O-acetyltransferase [Mucilaginibacter sp.]|uniref:xenobiotic acyltransferase family protein n=1 Tax=Mucilaginibacter sp. TaxID=1882438 RepID=UPI002844D17C|nr:CatB-related O-acetyltransferase [Mucilaginibacter sp.]MDR3697546.1 DapH/DapD/GlmU-related protein [Mucilaginibacter sp.]